MRQQCVKIIRPRRGRGASYQCSRSGVFQRKGKWYCRQHDPLEVLDRRAHKYAHMDAQLKGAAESERRERIRIETWP